MKSASRYLLSGLALHITAQCLGTNNPKPPLADEYLHRIKRWYSLELPTGAGFPNVPGFGTGFEPW